ncbi:MAG: type VI secretion system tip protein VgrG [Nannocystaceae bacterium]|nr:type VI secretion system tip protein VgrG [Nannocystaceae bacterium]
MGGGSVSGLTGEQIASVKYAFDVQGGPNPDWAVRRFHLHEGLSRPYSLVVDLLTEEVWVNPDELLGANARFELDRRDVVRVVCGVIERVDYVGVNAEQKLMLRVHVVPALRMLGQQLGCRIFQDQSVPEILGQVLDAGLGLFGRTQDSSALSTDVAVYPKRDYCVQFRESTLDFVSRLMEENGIAYYFETVEDKEQLVLVDQIEDDPNKSFPGVVILDPDGDGVIPILTTEPDLSDRESLRYFDWCQPLQPNQVMVRTFNWKAFEPSEGLEATHPEAEPDNVRRQYVFADERKTVDENAGSDPQSSFDGSSIDESSIDVKRRFELFQRHSKLGEGRSNVTGFRPGCTFTLDDRSFVLFEDLKFLLTRVYHQGEDASVERAAGDGGTPYDNGFECIPVAHAYRPRRSTPTPRVSGPQTATVTGEPGEEIHTDKHGRIKVRFHWDDESPLDGTSSCWVRVAQSWAGPGWGTLFIPRVGMEVVVEFLDGNPDRPLVTGCVYNSTNTPPYTLPDDKTKSTIKSNSSLDGGGFNELRFEDAAGSEELFLHASKDMNEVVVSAHSTTVGHNQTHNVDVDRTRTVKGNEVVTIEGNQTVVINGVPTGRSKSTCKVKGTTVSINDTYKLHTDNQILLDAPTLFKLEVGGSTITVEPDRISLIAGGGASLVLDADVIAMSNAGSTILMTGDINAKSNSNSTLDLMADAQLQSSAGSFLKLTGDALLKANAGAQVGLTANADVKGATVSLLSDAGEVVAGAGGVDVKNAAISITGTTVTIDGGGGKGSFAGGLVKLN